MQGIGIQKVIGIQLAVIMILQEYLLNRMNFLQENKVD